MAGVIEEMAEAFASQAPELHERNCKVEGKKYDKTNKECLCCIVTETMLKSLAKAAISCGRMDVLCDLLVGITPKDEEDN